jgi:hypothetical protein
MMRMASKNTKKPGNEEDEELSDDVLTAMGDTDEAEEESEWEGGGGDTDEEEDF